MGQGPLSQGRGLYLCSLRMRSRWCRRLQGVASDCQSIQSPRGSVSCNTSMWANSVQTQPIRSDTVQLDWFCQVTRWRPLPPDTRYVNNPFYTMSGCAMNDRALYSVTEARELLGRISRNSIYALLRSGELASVVLGCRRFISHEAISALIAKSTTTTSPAIEPTRSRKPDQNPLPLPLTPIARPGRRRRNGK